jgi:hypothetical protein
VSERPATPAIGGERTVPTPDLIARDYLLLALRLDQRIPGLVDGYFGPADLKDQVDMEQLRSPARLAEDAEALLARLDGEVGDPARRDWLHAQLVALQTHAQVLAGDALPYVEHVTRCFDAAPERWDEADFAKAAAELDRLVPGPGDLRDRLARWDARFVVTVDRLPPVVDWLVDVLREHAIPVFGLPEGESLRVSLVSRQPWSGYNWYDGGLRSRVDLNTDLPIRAPDLVGVLAHETYAGHHLEHAWKEAELVDGHGHLEASALLINAPESLVSEGLAQVGRQCILSLEDEVDLLVELFARAALPLSADPAVARDAAERSAAIRILRDGLRATEVNAALMRHADGADRETVRAWLERAALLTPERAAKRLEFIDHPLWRTYVFVYAQGAALLERWLAVVPPAERAARFRRLLVEPLTPSVIAAEAAEVGSPRSPVPGATPGVGPVSALAPGSDDPRTR